jgi:hypothetical protein
VITPELLKTAHAWLDMQGETRNSVIRSLVEFRRATLETATMVVDFAIAQREEEQAATAVAVPVSTASPTSIPACVAAAVEIGPDIFEQIEIDAQTKANVQNPVPDLNEIIRAISLLKAPGDLVELRSPGSTQGTWSGFYSDLEELAKDSAELSAKAGVQNTYWTLQQLRPRVVKNGYEIVGKGAGTSDEHVAAYRWLLIDSDPVRSSGDQKTCSP